MKKLHRIAAQISAAVLLTAGVAVVASAPATAAGTSDVTVYLTPPDPAGLAAVAQATNLSHEERLARVRDLLPDPTPVVERLTALGMTVTSENPWSVTVAAPATQIDRLFGTRPTLASTVDATLDQIRAATGSLPLLPSSLHGLVSAVLPAGGPAVMRAHAASPAPVTYTGSQIRAAYNQPYDGSGSNPTIASIQFATDPNLQSDMGAGAQVTTVNVDGGATDTSAADEVALDQEAMLAVAPTLKQRIYSAPNGSKGIVDAYQAVLTDVLNGHTDIVALTTSWGQCESSLDPSVTTSTDSILQALVGLGVTVFAASGDNGIYDCGSPGHGLNCLLSCTGTTDVDFPASSTAVVGVGGTTLSQSGGGWAETAWSCTSGSNTVTSTGDCYAAGGSGGGASARFAAPPYQQRDVKLVPYVGNAHRLVPDIAAVGDPNTGFDTVVGGQHKSLGGTSLAAPVSAALFAGTLSHYGVLTGVGDIHSAIYDTTSSLTTGSNYGRDITVGTNGASANKGSDPSVQAAKTYDTVTGVGSLFWDSLRFFLIPHVPSVDTSMTSTGTNVTAAWQAGRYTSGAALTSVSVTITGPDGSAVVRIPQAAANATATFPGVAGATYTMTVTAIDTLGHVQTPPSRRYTVPQGATGTTPLISGPGTLNVDDSALKGAGWKRVRSRGAYGGKVLTTSARGRRVSVKVNAQTITLTFMAGPRNGRLTVLVDGRKIVVDQYSKRAVRKSVTLLAAAAPGTHTLTFVCSGTHSSRSRGNTVDVDFLTAYLP